MKLCLSFQQPLTGCNLSLTSALWYQLASISHRETLSFLASVCYFSTILIFPNNNVNNDRSCCCSGSSLCHRRCGRQSSIPWSGSIEKALWSVFYRWANGCVEGLKQCGSESQDGQVVTLGFSKTSVQSQSILLGIALFLYPEIP